MNTIKIENRNGYQVIALNRGSANPMNLQMLQELTAAFENAAKDSSVGGVVLTGNATCFTGGLDVVEMYNLDLDGLTHFWTTFKNMVLTMVRFPKPFVAAIPGHSPAGGCVMAICADYRVMVIDQRSRIGLNEIPVGITLPENIFHLYAFWIGTRHAYQYLMEGRLMLPEEAAAIGLVDELVEADGVLERAEIKMQQYLKFDPVVWCTSKANIRRQLIANVEANFLQTARLTAERLYTPQARAFLAQVVQKLTK